MCISRLHRKLCSRTGSEPIVLDDYLLDLRDDFAAAFLDERTVELIVNADPILVEPAVASTIGLVLNELVTNAIKHGDNEQLARIEVSCGSLDGGTLELQVVNQVPAKHSRTGDGDAAGTGTRISRALIARYAGKLHVEREGHRIVHTMILSLA
jgi:two-component sensor histidine kinase